MKSFIVIEIEREENITVLSNLDLWNLKQKVCPGCVR